MENDNKLMFELLDESVLLEKLIGELYTLFAVYYKDEEIFWTKLANEEGKHALILEGIRPWIAMGATIDQCLLQNLTELKEKNISIKQVIKSAVDNPPTIDIAFNLAYKIERTASEVHYQKMITKETDNKLIQSMQILSAEDQNHAKRIRAMMKTLKIEVIQN